MSYRVRVAQVRAKYLNKINELVDERAGLEAEISYVEVAQAEAKSAEDRLVEDSNTGMKAGGGVAAASAAGTVTLLAKFGLIVCPALLIPAAAGILAANALSNRNKARRYFGSLTLDLAKQKVDLKISLARVERDLEDKRSKFSRVEELWRKIR